jgi:hypothetical protein
LFVKHIVERAGPLRFVLEIAEGLARPGREYQPGFAGLFVSTQIPQHVDQPEPAYEKTRFREAEVILASLARRLRSILSTAA